MSKLGTWMSGKLRTLRYSIARASDAERAFLDCVTAEKWGPTSTQLQEVVRHSRNYEDWASMCVLFRNVFDLKHRQDIIPLKKGLLTLEYLIWNGPATIRSDSQEFAGMLRSLTYHRTCETGETAACEAVVRKKAQDILAMLNDDEVYNMERKRAAMLQRSVRSAPPPPARDDESHSDDEAPTPPPDARRSAAASAPAVVQFDLFEQKKKPPEVFKPFDPWQQTPKPVDDLLEFDFKVAPPPQEPDFLDLSGPTVIAQKREPDAFAEFANLIDLNRTERPRRSYGPATQARRGTGATLGVPKAMK